MEKPFFSKEPYTVNMIGSGGWGMRFISGKGEPGSDVGAPGDVYLDTDNGDLYVNKNGTWSLEMNLVGPEGPKGDRGEEGPKGDRGEPGADGFPTEAQWNELVGRVQSLEDEVFNGA